MFSHWKDGELTLVEIAPGIDIERDILSAMDFKPRISENLKEMPKAIFEGNMGWFEINHSLKLI